MVKAAARGVWPLRQDDMIMKLGLKVQPKQRRSRKPKQRGLAALAAHGAFAPGLGLWGALLGGLVVAVVPPVLIENAIRGTLMATFDIPQQLVLALTAALVVGGLLFVAAFNMHLTARRRAHLHPVMEFAGRRVRPIDPARDLGSRSLDEPLETMPFASPAWRDADMAEPQALAAIAPDNAVVPDAPVAEANDAPRALDLAEFAQLPGRNAVWVEEPAPTPAPAPEAPLVAKPRRAAAPAAQPGTAALARLRTLPPSELSMAEMVERFAGALHEHRAAPPPRALTREELAAREAALAEALKALAALSGGMPAEPQRRARQEPLRSALAQLHGQRGAA